MCNECVSCATQVLCRHNSGRLTITPNGPAIWGGCVGALKRHGALFAVRVQILLSITSVAVQV